MIFGQSPSDPRWSGGMFLPFSGRPWRKLGFPITAIRGDGDAKKRKHLVDAPFRRRRVQQKFFRQRAREPEAWYGWRQKQ